MVEPFVLAGKAKDVFRLIELKARREVELKNLLQARSCRYAPTACCNKPHDVQCSQIDCEVWWGKLGSEEFKGEKNDGD